MSVTKKPMVLVILDGYGYREDQQDNAIYSAKTPVMDALWAKRPHTLIDASGLEVGLPDRQMGNSEVGHVNLGAGRIVYQDLTRLDVEIKERTFFANPVLTGAVDKAVAAGKAVHIMGLMSAWRRSQPRRPHHGDGRAGRRTRRRENLSARFPRWPRHAAAQR